MEQKREVQSPRKGMNRDSAPFEVGKEEYTFALNANFHNENGGGQVVLQNEPSNIKCSGFKPGFKVIGHKYFMNRDQTFFFLVNPTTGVSEIGYISSFYEDPSISPTEQIDSLGNITVVLETPLEMEPQTAVCTYTTLISDFCDITQTATGCLNFSRDFPIHERNVIIKDEKLGAVMYFTDNLNPQRHLQIDNLEEYYTIKDDCTGEIERTCFQCDKLRIFPLFDKPCLRPEIIQNGGNLSAGNYEVIIALSDAEGNERTDYFALTNPIPIFDKGNRILDQTLLDYETSQAVKVSVFDIDSRYEYYKIVVIRRSGLDGAVTAFINGIYPADRKSVTIYTHKDKQRIDLVDIIHRRPFYEKSKGLAESNGYLFHSGLTKKAAINLQPIISLIGSSVKWMTVEAKESAYEDGIFVSNYTGYYRGEVYPLGLKAFMKGGHELPLGVLIPRPPTQSEVAVLGGAFPANNNTESILGTQSICQGNDRDRRWQFEDTSTIDADICQPEGTTGFGSIEEERETEMTCIVTDEDGSPTEVVTIPNGVYNFNSSLSIINYINTHLQAISESTGPNGAEIRDILNNPQDFEGCTPELGDNCEGLTLVQEEMYAISVEEEIVGEVSAEIGDYEKASSPASCTMMYEMNTTTGEMPYNDSAFVTAYMFGSEQVFKRIAPTNVSCGQAVVPAMWTGPGSFAPSSYLDNKGGSFASLRTGLNSNVNRTEYRSTLFGTSGDANYNIGGTNYAAVFSGDLTTTANNFAIAHGATILSSHNITVTASAGVLIFVGDYVGFPTINVINTSGDLTGIYDRRDFTEKIHTNAIWFKVDFAGQPKKMFEVSPILCENGDDNSNNQLRISVFTSCSSTTAIAGSVVVDMSANSDNTKMLELTSSDFSGTAYIAIDSALRTRNTPGGTRSTLMPPCGCFSALQRDAILIKQVNYVNLTFGKRQTYKSLCTFTVALPNDCDPAPYQKGNFSYWESVERYPCNEHLWDSSKLIIPQNILPAEFRTDFENYYVASIQSGNYVLNSDANFMDKPIRHYKFPDSTKVPFMTPGAATDSVPFKSASIYPIGFFIPNNVINAFLDVAVLNGLISQEDRDNITRFEVFRGDRRVDKSIIAKGLLFDMYGYIDVNSGQEVYYPNYPLNSQGMDDFNNVLFPTFKPGANNFFSFHSPNTHFLKPSLPGEMLVEGYQFGYANHHFDEVLGHPTYVILGDKAHNVAGTLAGIEAGLEAGLATANSLMNVLTAGTPYGVILSVAAMVLELIQIVIQAIQNGAKYKLQWEETFYNMGKPHNFAYYQTAIGHYNVFAPNNNNNSKLRGLNIRQYLDSGRYEVTEETSSTKFNINAIDREDFVLLRTNVHNVEYTQEFFNWDNRSVSPSTSSRKNYPGTGKAAGYSSRAGSPYATLKQYLPAQYGGINDITWIHTGFCGNLEGESCAPIFGGDVVISRFAVKRKMPYFLNTAMGLAPLTPFKYSDYININPPDVNFATALAPPHFFIDYKINDEGNLVSILLFPSLKSPLYLDSIGGDTSGTFYVKPPNKFYLYSYGIPYFLVESEINCNFRYAKREAHENFYPLVGDVLEWTQEVKNSIRNANTYFYNTVYSQGHTLYPYEVLPSSYDPATYAKINNLRNSVIYSMQDNSQNSFIDPWLIYKPNDWFDFEKQFGDLIAMVGIESEQILAKFTNGFSIFGATDVLRDRLTPETKNLGQGGIFAGRTVNFNRTELGYAGTQHTAHLSCEFGHFWVDAKRGKVFQLSPGGKDLREISKSQDSLNNSCEKWFKEQLPFKILQYAPGLSWTEMDNNYKSIGITIGWDDRTKRVFITKRDWVPKNFICYRDGEFYDANIDNYTEVINQYIASGYEFVEIDQCRLKFELKREGQSPVIFVPLTKIELGDPRYFDDCSWTIAYSPTLQTWISYYSFQPDYYISYNTHFQTGLNTDHEQKFGVWSHLPFISSYQVFYGEKHPFTIEYPITTNLTNSVLSHIEYYLDVRKYYNKHNYVNRVGVGFNKAIVYNDHQNTGLLELIVQVKNDLRQNLFFPQHSPGVVRILQTEINNKYSFNYLYNSIKDESAGLPIFRNNCNDTQKTIDIRLLDYRYTHKDRMRGDYFKVRLTNDAETRFKFLFRVGFDERSLYSQ